MRLLPALLLLLFAGIGLAQPPGPWISRTGTDDCAAPTPVPNCIGGTYTDSGTTSGANDTVTGITGGCLPGGAVPGPDVIYRINPGTAASEMASLRVQPAAGYDVAIYLLRSAPPGCPAGTGNVVANCQLAVNAAGPGEEEQIPAATLATLPVDNYYLFIDSTAVGPAASGSYTLSIGPSICPVELLEFAIE